MLTKSGRLSLRDWDIRASLEESSLCGCAHVQSGIQNQVIGSAYYWYISSVKVSPRSISGIITPSNVALETTVNSAVSQCEHQR
jgi:hypothetical protein